MISRVVFRRSPYLLHVNQLQSNTNPTLFQTVNVYNQRTIRYYSETPKNKEKSNILEYIDNKKLELKDKIEDGKHQLQDKLDDKKDEIQHMIEHKKEDLIEYIEDTKIDLREKLEDKSIELNIKKKNVKSRLVFRLVDKSIEYLKYYTTVLQNAFPDKIVETYNIFSRGTKQLMQDMRTYSRVKDSLVNAIDKGKAHGKLSVRDYVIFINLHKDALRVAPVLIISAFPFAQNIIFPLALLYPKLFLSSQFLTNLQKEEIIADQSRAQQDLHPKLRDELIRCTDLTYESIPELVHLRKMLKSGTTFSEEDILDLRPLFELGGYLDIRHLTRKHDKLLASYHRVWYIMFPYKHLERYSNIFWRMDQAIIREGINISTPGLSALCLQRGLNPTLYSDQEKVVYLHSWLSISSKLQYKDISLLLHLPIFLANRKQPDYDQ